MPACCRTSDLPLRRKLEIQEYRKDGRFRITFLIVTHFVTHFLHISKNGAAPALYWPPVDTLYNHNTLYNQLICQRIFSSNTLTKYSSMLMIVAWKGRASAHNGGGATPFFILYIWLPFLVLPRRLSWYPLKSGNSFLYEYQLRILLNLAGLDFYQSPVLPLRDYP